MERKELKVGQKDVGKRLDVFLQEQFPNFSRAWIQKLIKLAKVTVNRAAVTPSHKLRFGEIIHVEAVNPTPLSLEVPGDVSKLDIPIIYEDEELLVINKPVGLVVHPSFSHRKGTLAHWLIAHYPTIKKVGEHPLRPGIVHRLDKDASGLMVIAKTPEMFIWLKQMFKDRRVIKKYLVLVRRKMDEQEGEISFPIARSTHDPTRQRVLKKDAPRGREAFTAWHVKEELPGFTLLEVTPRTGRMHQIRVHLTAIGHSVAGDQKYRPRGVKDPENLKRLFLHASYLSLPTPQGEQKEFHAPLPRELLRILKDLGSVVQ